MTVPHRIPAGRPYRRFAPVAGLALAAGLLAACGTTVSGHPVAGRNPVTPAANADGGLAKLLPDPSQFPSRYTAIVLPADTAKQAADDLNGYLPGAQVDPSTCMPATPSGGPVAAVGNDDDARTTLTVVLTRSTQPLSALRDQLQQCGTVRLGHSGSTSIVTTELNPPPPVNADDSLAIKRTVSMEHSQTGLKHTMQSLVGQIGDVRINVTYMTSGSTSDGEGLDALFTTALRKVRKG
ncbi:sensor domain-containing protein [Nocardia concava]|uniref:sensor domain-containing protein n=1 Tax=Nocardia concava TaxID=257281 RepID=UPI001FDF9DE3|nr:sensor domain-containing protein [Nocardia concava]